MILVTGGNGYIGSELSQILSKIDEEFIIFDNFSGSSPLNVFFVNGKAELVWGDVRNVKELEAAFKDVDMVIHLAAKLPSTPGILDEVNEEVEDVNYFGTLNVLELARKYDVCVVFVSTCNVYSVGKDLREDSEVKPSNSYSKSKLKAEKACLEYYHKYGLDVKILRLATVYGFSPGVRFNLVVNFFVLRALSGKDLIVFGDGNNWRPFIHVRDAARACLFFAHHGKSGEIYNVGCENYRIREVAEIVRNVVNPSVEIHFLKDKKPEFSYHVDFTKMREAGFEPEYSLQDGVRDLAERLIKLKELIR